MRWGERFGSIASDRVMDDARGDTAEAAQGRTMEWGLVAEQGNDIGRLLNQHFGPIRQ